MEELKSRIIELNLIKDNYANKKIKGETTNTDNKDIISSLIYVISECRKVARGVGISDDGKINNSESPSKEQIEIFKHLNESVKNLKTQIVMLTNSSPESLRLLMRNQSDKNHIEIKNEKIKLKNDEKTRQQEMREKLREKLDNNHK